MPRRSLTQKRECAGRAAIDAYNVRGSFAANGFVSTKLFFPASRLKEPAETDNGRKRTRVFQIMIAEGCMVTALPALG